MTDFKIQIEENPAPEDLRQIGRELSEFNGINTGSDNWLPLTFFLRNQENAIVGGLYGELVWDWFEIKIVWIDSHLRGLGFGTKLMQAAEAEVVRRRGRHAMLDTFSFQALDFYRKLGYEIFGKLNDFPRGQTRYFLRKNLKENESS